MPQSDSAFPDFPATPEADCAEAMQLQIAGRLDAAQASYRKILRHEPTHALANHCLGMLLVQLKSPADGLPLLLAALEAAPQSSDYWLGYLEALLQCGQHGAASNALLIARQHGLDGPATAEFASRLTAQSIDAGPPAPVTRADHRRDERFAGKQESALLNLVKRQNFSEAQTLARTIVQRFPGRGLAWKVLGAVLGADVPNEEALDALRRAATLLPGDAEAQTNAGVTLAKLQRFDEAEMFLRRAVEARPGASAPHVDLGNLYQMQGRVTEAARSMRLAVALLKADEHYETMVYSSLLFLLSHDPDVDAVSLFAEHCKVGDIFEAAARAWRPQHANTADAERRLRIGFVSGDLCDHAVAFFIEPVLRALHVRRGMVLYAYHTNPVEDHVSRRLAVNFEQWLPAAALSDAQLARRIVADQIDILIDLSGHTAHNRLRVFAAKPAPVQASWIGYPGTTGLRTMDYYLAERHFLPRDAFDRQFTEKLVHLPAGAAFQPSAGAPPVGPLPALRRGRINFGSFNRPGKINAGSVALWARVLRAVPGSTMTVAGVSTSDRGDRITAWFADGGIAAERLTYHPRCDIGRYLSLHHEVDVCLDALPYSGGTTTYHAFWMGVPTLTIAGPTPASRQGSAIMGQLGLDEFVATDAEDLVAKALYWSEHLTELALLRTQLRARWQQAPIRQIDVVADGFERALRHMWRRWCAGMPAEFFEIAPSDSAT